MLNTACTIAGQSVHTALMFVLLVKDEAQQKIGFGVFGRAVLVAHVGAQKCKCIPTTRCCQAWVRRKLAR